MTTATTREPLPAAEQSERLDRVVARSGGAADAFRRIDDQEAVDRIVWALVVAGLQHAVELARLPREETGLGGFEDKVVKNYIATEFLHDYLKDKRSVGVIDEDAERAIQDVAEPVGVVLALTPMTNPTSTVLFRAIVAALHGSADVPMAVVDMLISKTFDSSLICPAEQTCIVDDAVWDETRAELRRMGAPLLSDEETAALAAASFGDDGAAELGVLGRSCAVLGEAAGFEASADDKILLATLPSDLEELQRHPLLHEKLMPVLGLVRSPSVAHALRAAELVLENGGMGHTSAVYAMDEDVIDAFAKRIRTGRILVNASTAVGALGGVYNAMTPTFSLGCGTWGGSVTTENINYRHLLNVKAVSRRQTPPQWFRVPADTYFNPGALEAGVSIFASPYTDAFCMQALHLILDALPRAYADGSDLAARTAMSNAATLAGLALSNAFVVSELGVVGSEFEAALPELADAAFADPSLRTNPRMPLLSELIELLQAGFHGRS